MVPAANVERLFAACESALPLRGLRLRTDVIASDVWQAALVVDHFYGPRTRDLFGMCDDPDEDGDLPGLRRASIVLDAPHPDGEMPFEWEWGWLTFVTEKTGAEITLPMSAVVRAHLSPLLPGLNPKDRILSVPRTKGSFYRHWNTIKRRAGVPSHLQEIRKTASTAWNRLWPGLGEFVLGQRPETVNATYYNDFTGKLMELLPQFPFPAVFSDVRPRQRSLFD